MCIYTEFQAGVGALPANEEAAGPVVTTVSIEDKIEQNTVFFFFNVN